MLPNRFSDEGQAPEYNTVDATLWYFEAIRAYYEETLRSAQGRPADDALLRDLFAVLQDIVDWHVRGTRYQIHADPADGLLHAGEPGVHACARHLLTSHGLRSLELRHPDYKGHHGGDRRTRDAAYHQGTVWGWPIGPFVSAHLCVYRDPALARSFLAPLVQELDAHGLRSLCEIFDGDPPHTPRSCIAQAWTVAEVLRVWKETQEPSGTKMQAPGKSTGSGAGGAAGSEVFGTRSGRVPWRSCRIMVETTEVNWVRVMALVLGVSEAKALEFCGRVAKYFPDSCLSPTHEEILGCLKTASRTRGHSWQRRLVYQEGPAGLCSGQSGPHHPAPEGESSGTAPRPQANETNR